MVDITFPLTSGDMITVDSANIQDMQKAGSLTVVHMPGGLFYRSPAPLELFEIAIASGGGPVVSDYGSTR